MPRKKGTGVFFDHLSYRDKESTTPKKTPVPFLRPDGNLG